MQPNPAFSDGAHFRFKPLQTSHLKSNRMCQHPISALTQLSWFCNMVWTWDMSDTALPIIGRGLQPGNWADKYSGVDYWSLSSSYLVADIENNLPVNRSPSLQMHTWSPKHTKETQIYNAVGMWGRAGLISTATEVDNEMMESWSWMWREKSLHTDVCVGELVVILCLSGNLSVFTVSHSRVRCC